MQAMEFIPDPPTEDDIRKAGHIYGLHTFLNGAVHAHPHDMLKESPITAASAAVASSAHLHLDHTAMYAFTLGLNYGWHGGVKAAESMLDFGMDHNDFDAQPCAHHIGCECGEEPDNVPEVIELIAQQLSDARKAAQIKDQLLEQLLSGLPPGAREKMEEIGVDLSGLLNVHTAAQLRALGIAVPDEDDDEEKPGTGFFL